MGRVGGSVRLWEGGKGGLMYINSLGISGHGRGSAATWGKRRGCNCIHEGMIRQTNSGCCGMDRRRCMMNLEVHIVYIGFRGDNRGDRDGDGSAFGEERVPRLVINIIIHWLDRI